MKCKIADCLSILVSFEKKQRIRKFIFKTYDLSLNQYVLKGLATVFSLGSLGRVSDILTFYYQWASLVSCNLKAPSSQRKKIKNTPKWRLLSVFEFDI